MHRYFKIKRDSIKSKNARKSSEKINWQAKNSISHRVRFSDLPMIPSLEKHSKLSKLKKQIASKRMKSFKSSENKRNKTESDAINMSNKNRTKLIPKIEKSHKIKIKNKFKFNIENLKIRFHSQKKKNRKNLNQNSQLMTTKQTKEFSNNSKSNPPKTFKEVYKMIRVLGNGSNSTVYLCKKRNSNQLFAVKKISKNNFKHRNELRNFKVLLI
jgi:hypothetical protein